ncbi:MAG: rod shape-determining protein [bacterium]|nr:rod shape-determining protein [bacterium]
MLDWGKRVAIDLGTYTTRVFLPSQGVVLQEPTLLAVRLDNNKVVAVGKEAEKMMGRTPDEIVAVRPVNKGVISDFQLAATFIEHTLRQVTKIGLFHRPTILVSLPAGVSQVERKVLVEAFLTSGARAVHIVPRPLSGAVGANIPMAEPIGSVILDIGGGLTEVSLVSMGNVISIKNMGFGGIDLTYELIKYLESEHNLIVGFQAAEKMKRIIGSVGQLTEHSIKDFKKLHEDGLIGIDDKGVWMEISGRDGLTSLPNKIKVYSSDINQVIDKKVKKVSELLGQIMKHVPPELVTDVMDKGVVMMGGGSLLNFLPEYLTNLVGVPCYLAQQPATCVIEGSGKILENLDLFEYTLG